MKIAVFSRCSVAQKTGIARIHPTAKTNTKSNIDSCPWCRSSHMFQRIGKNGSITLNTLVAAASATGMTLHLRLEPRIDQIEAVETPPGFEPLVAKMNAALDHIATLPQETERRVSQSERGQAR